MSDLAIPSFALAQLFGLTDYELAGDEEDIFVFRFHGLNIEVSYNYFYNYEENAGKARREAAEIVLQMMGTSAVGKHVVNK